MRTVLAIVVVLTLTAHSLAEADAPPASTWHWDWKPAPGEGVPKVEVCPIKFDKRWAYSVEIDDGPASTLTVAQPLLARFEYTEAPPGVAGGTARPFVGGAAVIVEGVGTPNRTRLSWDQIRDLEARGWGVLNHSYWHTGNHWDPAKALKPADFRRELFWSRAMLGAHLGASRADAGFVYPSGDFNYRPYLAEFGLRSASRVGGRCRTLKAEPAEFLDLDRSYLDEGVWSSSNNPMAGFPLPGPNPGDLVIDFTHEIEPGPDSKNYRRWVERLTTIANRYGKSGDDSLWSAPTSEIIRYTLATRAARVEATSGHLAVTLPDELPGSALTLRLTGISRTSRLEAPKGGSLYRRGDQVWITSPAFGRPGSAPIGPRLELAYEGPVGTVRLDRPRPIAGVRLLQFGRVVPPKVSLIVASGKMESLPPGDGSTSPERWGSWLLFPAIPDRAAILSGEVRVDPDPALSRMEIWVESTNEPDR